MKILLRNVWISWGMFKSKHAHLQRGMLNIKRCKNQTRARPTVGQYTPKRSYLQSSDYSQAIYAREKPPTELRQQQAIYAREKLLTELRRQQGNIRPIKVTHRAPPTAGKYTLHIVNVFSHCTQQLHIIDYSNIPMDEHKI